MNTKLLLISTLAIIVLVTVIFVLRPERTDVIIPSSPGSVVTLDEQTLSQKFVVDTSCKSFIAEPCGPVVISGTVSNLNSITVVLVDQSYAESTDFSVVLQASKRLDTPAAKINTVSSQAGSWTTTIRGMFAGEYRVLVYDTNTKALLMDRSIVVVK